MPRFYYRREIKRSILKHLSIADIGKMVRNAVLLVDHKFGVEDYICILT